MADQRIIDACEVDKYLPIHQLNKLNEKGDKRYDIFPITLVQAVFDKTGIRLDAILSSFNYIFLPWAGSRELTRLQVQGIMRRKSLVICYRDLGDTIIIETCIINERGDDKWKLDESWKGFVDWLRDVIVEILGNLEDYPDIYQAFVDFLADFRKEITDAYMAEIEKEKQRAEKAESDLDDKLQKEIQRATGREDGLERDKMPRNVQFEARTGAAGSDPSVEYDEDSNTMTFVIPKGDKGDTGPRGPQGDKGEQGEAGKDGEDGADGQPGANGSDATVDTSQFATKEELNALKEQIKDLETGGDVNFTLETLTFNEGNESQVYDGTEATIVDLSQYCTEEEVNALIKESGVTGGGSGEDSDLPLPNLRFLKDSQPTVTYDGMSAQNVKISDLVDLSIYATDAEVDAKIREAQLSSGGGLQSIADLTFKEDSGDTVYNGIDAKTIDLKKYATNEELSKLQSKVDGLSSSSGTNTPLEDLIFSNGIETKETYDGTETVTVTAETIGALTEDEANELYVTKTEAGDYLTKNEASSLYLSINSEDYVKKTEYDTKIKELEAKINELEGKLSDLDNFVRSTEVHNISVENGNAGDGDLRLIFDN